MLCSSSDQMTHNYEISKSKYGNLYFRNRRCPCGMEIVEVAKKLDNGSFYYYPPTYWTREGKHPSEQPCTIEEICP